MAGLAPTMSGSAFVGQPPNNQDDSYIIRGLTRINGIPDQALNTYQIFPQNIQGPWPRIIAALSVAIALVLLITGTRIGLRFFRRDLRWGYDDIAIIPAAIGAIAWLGCAIGMASQGGSSSSNYSLRGVHFCAGADADVSV